MRQRTLGGRPLTRLSRIGCTVILVVTVLEVLGLGARYLMITHRYVSSDNAQVDGDAVRINAPVTGLVSGWRAAEGTPVARNEVVGRIRIRGSGAQPEKVIRAPGRGTVVRNTVIDNEYVSAGTTLALAYDISAIYVTARVSESEIQYVHPGQPVDITIDAYPQVPVTGVVTVIPNSAAGAFLLDDTPGVDPTNPDTPVFPGPDTDPSNPQREDQYYPVRIAFTYTGMARPVPGMNVSVQIHRF
jgi:multidrug resistance efflux pump